MHGGDHGKATYVFVATLIFHYNDIRRETYRLEIKLGEINHEKDKMEYVEQLIRKINYGSENMNVSEEGDACMRLDEL